jgi:hypothetical protein
MMIITSILRIVVKPCYYYPGTFAVVCLMVGSAVEKANCGAYTLPEGGNSTLTALNPVDDNGTLLLGE